MQASEEEGNVAPTPIHHIFLPRKLPQTSDLSHDTTTESVILTLLNDVIQDPTTPESHVSITRTKKLFETWEYLQGNYEKEHVLVPCEISASIRSMKDGDSLALYIRAQNAGLILTRPADAHHRPDTVIVSTFAASLRSQDVLSAPGDLTVNYPASSIHVPFSKLLKSESFGEQIKALAETMCDISMPKTKKSDSLYSEIRDVADPMMVSRWLTGTLCNQNSDVCTHYQRVFKKVRDEVNFHKSTLPFRRSGLWLTAKVVLHLSLINELEREKGTFMYKLIILKFLVTCCRDWYPDQDPDTSMQMIGKLARRLFKLQSYLMEKKSLKHMETYQMLRNEVLTIVERTRESLDSQWKSLIEKDAEKSKIGSFGPFDFESDIVHKLINSWQHLNSNKCLVPSCTFNIQLPECPPRYLNHFDSFPVEHFIVEDEINIGVVLFDFEQSVQQWEPSISEYPTVLELFKTYIKKAKKYYTSDPVGGSRMVLTCLIIIKVLDEQSTKRFPLLLEHRSGIDVDIIKDLLIPTRSELELVMEVESYFTKRNKGTYPSLLEESTLTANSFSSRCASEDEYMIELREMILEDAAKKIEEKKQEVLRERKMCEELRFRASKLGCTYIEDKWKIQRHASYCTKCSLISQATSMEVFPYEQPLSRYEVGQNATVFELLIPNIIACLRDALYYFGRDICGNVSDTKNLVGKWIDYKEIFQYRSGAAINVTLGSSTKLFLDTYYCGGIHPDSELDIFIKNNGYNCIYTSSISGKASVKSYCTFQLSGKYQKLQWTLRGTDHTENEVLARQVECPEGMSLSEWKEFGSLRAGHRIQLRNIYRALVTGVLSTKTESVFKLICQAVWQTGPQFLAEDSTFYREAHEDLVDPFFTVQLLKLLDDVVEKNSKNWTEHYILLTVVVLAGRVLSLTTFKEVKTSATKLLHQCRYIAEEWVEQITELLAKMTEAAEVSTMRLKLVQVAACIGLTFRADYNDVHYLLQDGSHVTRWLQSMAVIHDNVSLSISGLTTLPSFTCRVLRWVRNTAVELEPHLRKLILKDQSGLQEFIKNHWSEASRGDVTDWRPMESPHDQCYYAYFSLSNCPKIRLTMDIVLGSFLVNGCPVGRLPKSILRHPEFQRIFKGLIFDILPAAGHTGTYVTLYKYHNANYSFLLRNDILIVTETKDNGEQFELIPHTILKNDIPFLLQQNYSHWWNKSKNYVDFRSTDFTDEYFRENLSYRLDLESKRLTKLSTKRLIVDINSQTQRSILSFMRKLEHVDYINVMYNELTKDATIELPRMGLHFVIDKSSSPIIESKEYRGMKVSNNQKFGTFIGLENGLLLEEVDSFNTKNPILLIPHGNVNISSGFGHQNVVISCKDLHQPEFFVFEVDSCLQQLRAGQGHAGWIFLSYLHAATASPLPDPFTGLTGTESAFHILQSGHCWSCQPFDRNALRLLNAIDRLSPKREFYPPHLKSMQTITWRKEIPPMAAHDGFQLITEKLIFDSQRLAFAFDDFQSSNNKKSLSVHDRFRKDSLVEEVQFVYPKDENESLSTRAYWRHNSSYSENAQISQDFNNAFKAPPKTRLATKFECGLDDEILKSVRLIAHMGQTWTLVHTFATPTLLLKEMLLVNENLTGRTGLEINHVVTEWLNMDFRNSWLDLYNFARNVQKEHRQSEWVMLLSLLAFRETPLDQLKCLHAIAVHPGKFPDSPPYAFYENPTEYFTEDKVNSICKMYKVDLHVYQRTVARNSKEEEYHYNKRCKESLDFFVDIQANKLTKIVLTVWPVETYNFNTHDHMFPLLQLEKIHDTLNNRLMEWYHNHELRNFVEAVGGNVLSLEADQKVFTSIKMTQDKDDLVSFFSKICIKENAVMNYHRMIQKRVQKLYIRFDASTHEQAMEIFQTGSFSDNDGEELPLKTEPGGIRKPEIISSVPIFPLESDDLCEIGNYYMRSLKNSWNSFQNTLKRHSISLKASVSQFEERREFYATKAQCMWKYVKKAYLPFSIETRALSASGLLPRIVPISMFPLMCEGGLEASIRNIIGATVVLRTLEKHANRCLKFALEGEATEFALRQELSNRGHENWSPAEKPEWLLLELEMDIMIRPVQVMVAESMSKPAKEKNYLMQLNMGEGKTAVIIPLLVASLADGEQLCRVTVLKSLFHTNQGSLALKIGGLLNRRLYTFPCSRDMVIGAGESEAMLEVYKECLSKRGVVLTLPEHRLSFQLKGYEKSRSHLPDDFKDAQNLLKMQRWLKENVREVLDESDEILQHKYQLIYTFQQLPICGGCSRWNVAKSVLHLLPSCLTNVIKKFGERHAECEYNLNHPEEFPHCRLQKLDCYEELCKLIAENILRGESTLQFPDMRESERNLITKFWTIPNIEESDHKMAVDLFPPESYPRNIVLLLRGILAFGVLSLVLTKRWRVNYGVSSSGYRLMAVPFRAKDVAAERTEFGHPDMAIILTYLSYYYSGLTEDQFEECLKRLKRHSNQESQYNVWVERCNPSQVHPSILKLTGVNFSNYEQRKQILFPTFLKNMAVVDFYLDNVVFPRECKQFGYKMICTPWDLCPDDNKYPVTGFSGTNDTKLLLPLSIKQQDLPELRSTNGEVLNNVLKAENNNYEALKFSSSGRDILEKLVKNEVSLLLDVGALMIEYGGNKEVAKEWLKIVTQTNGKYRAAVYFSEDDVLSVVDCRGRYESFELSPYRGRLDLCVIYLDDFHTRGTDLKIPRGTRGCVTLGKGVTKAKLVQGCMRMRMLGQGHTVCFWASKEVDNEIRLLCRGPNVSTKDVLMWAIANSTRETRDGFIHWAAAGFNYAVKKIAHFLFDTGDKSEIAYRKLGDHCCEKEVVRLMDMYGGYRTEQLLSLISSSQYRFILNEVVNKLVKEGEIVYVTNVVDIFNRVGLGIVARCATFVPSVKRLYNVLDQEQERELERELEEEKQMENPGPASPMEHELHQGVINFIVKGSVDEYNTWSVKLPNVYRQTTLWPKIQEHSWGSIKLLATIDFSSVIKITNPGDCVDEFLRTPAWVARVTSETFGTVVLLLNPQEVNTLLPIFRSGTAAATLHMFAARLSSEQDTLLESMRLALPSSAKESIFSSTSPSIRWLNANLSLFSGSLYFKDKAEQDAYCQFLGFVPRPRTDNEQRAFDDGCLDNNGFVKPEFRKLMYEEHQIRCLFRRNPGDLVCGIVERRHEHLPDTCHVSRIVKESKKHYH